MPSDHQELIQGLRLAAIALASAVIAAAAVIGVGQVWLSRSAPAVGATGEDGLLVRTAG